MPDNMLDTFFKQKIEELSENPSNQGWNKENSWERLQKKRKQKLRSKFYYYAAAILIIGFILGKQFNGSINHQGKDEYSDSYTEYEKRQKLAEIEAKMSGNYTSVSICYVCEDYYYQIVKEDRPVQFRYFETNLN